MSQPQITYRGMPHSPAMDARILELVSKLDDLNPRITRCHVVVDETDRRKTKGNLFEVHVDIHVPGADIVATQKANEDAYVAISEAFEVVTRQLEEAMRRQRGQSKTQRESRGDNPIP
jgi:ribosomal subunit interface protein